MIKLKLKQFKFSEVLYYSLTENINDRWFYYSNKWYHYSPIKEKSVLIGCGAALNLNLINYKPIK